MLVSALLAFAMPSVAPVKSNPLELWFRKPAVSFTESCPVGNGRLGGMMFGGIEQERVVLNEITLWSGGVHDQNRDGAYKVLPEIIDLLKQGKNPEAEALVNKSFTSNGPGSSNGSENDGLFGCYQTLGDLEIMTAPIDVAPTNYRRSLDLANSIATTEFQQGNIKFKRELIASAPGRVLVYRLTSSVKGALNFDVKLSRKDRAKVELDGTSLRMSGSLAGGKGTEGMKYVAWLKAIPISGGEVKPAADSLTVSQAQEVLLFVTASTNYNGPIGGAWDGDKFVEASKARIEAAAKKSWRAHLSEHQRDYKKLFNRVSLELPRTQNSDLPTPERITEFAKGAADPALAALYYQFGRYLMISSSREGSLPANLQGIWAEEYRTPWNGDYHIDANVQMNYWIAETGNLAECALPLTSLVEGLRQFGARTAKEYYNAPGWVAHVITNVWGYTAPGESASWGATNSGAGWLCEHLFEHWNFNRDDAYLKRVYTTLKGSAEFYLATLVEEPKRGWLVSGVSNSPENSFRMPDGRTAHVCMGPTMDSQIIRELFTNTAEAARKIGDNAFADKLDKARARLAPTQIGKHGQVMEWLEDYEEPDPHHRHVSHLYGLFPSDQITPYGTPELAKASRVTLERRGDASTGWSMAWKINWWARLGDGDRAFKLLGSLLKPTGAMETIYGSGGGGSYANLFDAHPPFQIDGNFGAANGIGEMLVQSHRERPSEDFTIHLLPALPSAWPEGSVRGISARGGVEVSVEWTKGKLAKATLRRTKGQPGKVRVRIGSNLREIELAKGQSVTLKG